jgi:hypothetical protein
VQKIPSDKNDGENGRKDNPEVVPPDLAMFDANGQTKGSDSKPSSAKNAGHD